MTNPTSSSSSSFSYGWTYHVFLSFRGEDTRFGFTGNLYNALCEKGINTFIDDQELSKGEEITPALINAIHESRIAIVVFSENYASSTFCLEELANIMKCIKHKGRLVWPVFYQVDPSDVRYQKGSYGEALDKHETRIDKEKVKKWRSALQEAANLSGFHFKQGYEYEFIGMIIQEVSKKINRIPLYVAHYPVGLESRLQKVNSFLDLDVESNDGVQMVGIYGIGGIGKTTLACAVYNLIADQFESLCFLADIRENSTKHGLVQLQETLLFELVGEKDVKLWNVNKGIPIIKSRLCRKKILLILDDVDKLEQLKALAGQLDWFGPGSRIIITTRDKHLLHVFGVERAYEVEELNPEEALELFSWNAFKRKEVDPSYMDISNRIILYSNGLPLSLEIIGSDLFGKTVLAWKSALDTYKRIPDENIQEILRVSYDGLKGFQKEIFLDMACFFNGYKLRDVKNILLNGRGFPLENDIQVLIDKCLIKIDQCCCLRMHDLIEDMGREIARLESPSKPGERSRLWFSKDIFHVLKENKGTDKIEFIMLHLPKDKEVKWDGNAFKKMENLKVLIVKNARFSGGPSHLPKSLRVLIWWGYPEPSLPANFDPKKLAILDLSMSFLTFDNQPILKFKHLKGMKLSYCQLLKQVPDMAGAPNLKELHLRYCKNLVEVHDSVGFLDKLEYLNADGCTNLRILPCGINLKSLKHLSLKGCVSLKIFPDILGKMEKIRCVNLSGSAIRELPFSIGNLIGLKSLHLDKCYVLYELPSSIFMLPKLEKLSVLRCRRLAQIKKGKGQEQETVSSNVRDVDFGWCNLTDEYFATFLPYLYNVTFLDLTRSNITILPAGINACHLLHDLILDECKELREIRGLPPNIKRLSALNCISLTSQSEVILLSQTLHEGGTWFRLPGSSIPNWFNHCTGGPSLSFWFHNKLPPITLCVVGVLGDFVDSDFNLMINGIQQPQCFLTDRPITIRSTHKINHILLCYLQLDEVNIENGWNHGEISFLGRRNPSKPVNIKWMGVHVPELHTCMVDFRFTNPWDTRWQHHRRLTTENVAKRSFQLRPPVLPSASHATTVAPRSTLRCPSQTQPITAAPSSTVIPKNQSCPFGVVRTPVIAFGSCLICIISLIGRWTYRWWLGLQILGVTCLIISILAAVGSMAGVVLDLKTYKPFKTSY